MHTHTHTCTHMHAHTHTHTHTHKNLPRIHTARDASCVECTPDELAALVSEIRDKSGLVHSHTYHLVNYKNCFVGKELVSWLIRNKGYKSEYVCGGRWVWHLCGECGYVGRWVWLWGRWVWLWVCMICV